MRFPQEFIERVQESNNLVDLISQYTQLKPSGSSGYMGRCPFPDHVERTASFSVSESKQVYHCFGCQKSGNIFRFLQSYNGMSFPEAVEYLAKRSGIPLPEAVKAEFQKSDEASRVKKQMNEVNRLAADFFHQQFINLSLDQHPRRYALERGMTSDIIEKFNIGYAPEGWESLANYLQSKNVDLKIAEDLGLVKARTQGKSGYYDVYRNRLMFPIVSQMGDVIGFGGRVLDDGQPKYLNSPESLVFSKGKTLYGLNETAKFIRTLDQAIVVEGYMDFLALYQYGVQNVVANLGTALTQDHSKLLSRSTKNVIVLFDGDEAGKRAAVRSLPILLGGGVIPKGVTLPDELDPDEFLKEHGREALQKELNQAKDLFNVVLDLEMLGYKGEASQKIKLSDALRPIFSVIQDSRLKQLYLQEAASRMHVDPKWLASAVQSEKSSNSQFGALPQKPTTGVKNPPTQNESQSKTQSPVESTDKQNLDQAELIVLKGASKSEILLLKLVFKERYLMDHFLAANGMEFVSHKGVVETLNRALDVYRQNDAKFDTLLSLLISMVDQPGLLMASDLKLPTFGSIGEKSEGSDESPQFDLEIQSDELKEVELRLLKDCLKRVEEAFLAAEMDRLAKELKLNPSPEKLERFMNVQRRRLSMQVKPQESGPLN